MADYSKWDSLARAEEAAEAAEKEAKRLQNRERYYKEQEERKRKYLEEQKAKGKADTHGHSHGGESASGHSHDHPHGNPFGEKGVPLLEKIRRPACGCGYADVEEMKRAAEAAKHEPQISPAEKKRKKLAAVAATREHGKQLFGEGKYEEAFAVYERGVLILSGIFDLTPAEQEELTAQEVILDLNMAACKLKLREWKAAQEQCRMALQLDAKCVKAHFRIGQAWMGLCEYAEARAAFEKASALDSTGAVAKEVSAQLAEIRRREAQDREKQKQWTKQLEEKLRKEAQKGRQEEEEKENGENAVDAELAASLRKGGQISTAEPSSEVNWNMDGPQQQATAAALATSTAAESNSG